MGGLRIPERERALLEAILPPTLSTGEVAELLKVHPQTVRRWQREGKLRGRKHRSRRRTVYTRGDVLDLLFAIETEQGEHPRDQARRRRASAGAGERSAREAWKANQPKGER